MSDSRTVAVPVASSVRAHNRTRELTTAALVAALLAASAWIAIPVGAVPVTLQVFVVLLAALLLRPVTAGAALGAYLALGTLGVPVFSGGAGGPGVLIGPTGGYLVGFLLAACVGAAVRAGLEARGPQVLADGAAVLLGIGAIYALGWIGLRHATGMGWGAAFAAGVAPFLAVDAIKGVVAVAVARAIRRTGAA